MSDRAGTTACATLDLHINAAAQLFNSIDPAPFRDRDLDPAVIDYMVDWVEEGAGQGPLAIAITIDQPSPEGDDAALISAAIAENFRHLAVAKRRELSRLFRDGRISFVIGLGFVALAIAIGESIAHVISDERRAQIVADSAVIGAWVALWHPINIFLFDWWPLRRKAKLYDRLRAANVRIVTGTPGI